MDKAHAAASEEGNRTGPTRDALFGINTLLDTLTTLIGLDEELVSTHPPPRG